MRFLICLIVCASCADPTTPGGTTSTPPVDADGDTYLSDVDCDDTNPNVWSACASCVDVDRDGAFVGCDAFVTVDEDCDDGAPDRAPALAEVCDGADNDCDDEVDEGVLSTFAVDADKDGYTVDVEACTDPDGETVGVAGDCDDTDASVHPEADDPCDGVDQDCDLTVEQLAADHKTVQAAIDAASAGDRVCVPKGTFAENLVVDTSIRLEGAGAGATVIDGSSKGRVLTVTEAKGVALTGLTLQNGRHGSGAGLFVDSPDTTVDDVHVIDNRCEAGPCSGTGVYLTGNVVLSDVTISGNRAVIGDADNVYGVGLYAINGSVEGHHLVIDDNQGVTVGAIAHQGGGVFTQDVNLELYDTAITDNRLVGGQTRAHALSTSGGTVYLERVLVDGNSAYGDTYPYPASGALMIGSDAVLRNVQITHNHIDAKAGTIVGSAIVTWAGTAVTVEHSTIAHNTGNAPWASLVDAHASDLTFSHLIVYDNDGGSVYRNSSGTTSFEYSLIGASGIAGTAITSDKTNLVDVDPLFVNPKGGDFGLETASPAIDAGDPKVLDPDGTRADLGVTGGPEADAAP